MHDPSRTPAVAPGTRRAAALPAAGRLSVCLLSACLLSACTEPGPEALGTVEYDRIALPAPVSERIVRIAVREGERVRAGDVLLTLDGGRAAARTDAVEARLQQQRDALAELQAGTRGEQLRQAGASLAAAQARAEDAAADLRRLTPLGERRLVAAADVDAARAARRVADAAVAEARARLDELERGPRVETIARARAAVRAAEAELAEQADTAARLQVRAPRDGYVDSLPFEVGDQPSTGAALATLLVGDAPYARIYVPSPLRAAVKVGSLADVRVEGVDRPLRGRVRAIRSEPSFTPYYALSGEDAARLSYLAEVALEEAGGLPAGLPLSVRFRPAGGAP